MIDLQFDEATHTYTLGGRVLPSVTQVLAPYNGLEFVDKELLRITSEFGSHVHAACNLDNRDQLDDASLTDAVGSYVEGWRKFRAESGFVPIASEVRVLNQRMGYAGTLDCVGLFPQRALPVLIDIKTGSTMPKTVGPQTAAYLAAYQNPNVRQRYCVKLGPGSYQSKPLKDATDMDIFKAALTLYRARLIPGGSLWLKGRLII